MGVLLHTYNTKMYLNFPASLSVITLGIYFLMFSPVNSNSVLLKRKQDLHNILTAENHENILCSNESFLEY